MPIHTLIGIERESRFAALSGIERGEKALGTLGHERRRMDAVRMDMVGVAIARAEHTDSHKRGGRTEKRSAFHAHEFPPACLFCQPNTEMRGAVSNGRPYRDSYPAKCLQSRVFGRLHCCGSDTSDLPIIPFSWKCQVASWCSLKNPEKALRAG